MPSVVVWCGRKGHVDYVNLDKDRDGATDTMLMVRGQNGRLAQWQESYHTIRTAAEGEEWRAGRLNARRLQSDALSRHDVLLCWNDSTR
jgi:hypothetical protein